MHTLAEITQAHAFIMREFREETRHHAVERRVSVVCVLELLQFRHHRVPTALRDADREHDEERIKARLFNNDAVLCQVLRHNRCRNTRLGEVAFHGQPRRHDRSLNGIEHVEAFSHRPKSVPGFVGMQHPVFLRAKAFARKLFRPPNGEPPVVIVFANFSHRTTEINGFGNRFFNQCFASATFHHGGSHVTACNDCVLRRRRRVHHERFVKARAIQLFRFGILNTNLTCLGNTCQKLVRRVGRKDHAFLGARLVAINGMHVAVEGRKCRMRQPCLVKMKDVHLAVELFLDHFIVIDNAVVRRLRDRHDARLGILILDQRILGDFLLDRFPIEF